MHISLAAEPIFHFLGFPITNSLLASWIVLLTLIILAIYISSKIKIIPNTFQNFLEAVIEPLYNLVKMVAGEKASQFFPLVATFFIFIILCNWFGLIPGVGSIGFWEEKEGGRILVPFLRGATADLNLTLALALISVGAIQYFGIKNLKLSYLKRFFNLSNPIDFFVGILELISDFAKIISFSFRLFGNIFAGEVLLIVIAFLIPVFVSFPFYGLELFVGFIQALVFAMLTLVFMNIATLSHGEEVKHGS